MTGGGAGLTVVVAGAGAPATALAGALRRHGARASVPGAVAPGALPPGTTLVVAPADGPLDAPLLSAAADAGVEVVGEAELAWRLHAAGPQEHRPAPWLVVHGSRGTDATVTALGHVLVAAGLRTVVAGADGPRLLDAVRRGADPPAPDVVAVGLTRRQLHGSSTLRPHTAVVLDVEPGDDGVAAAARRVSGAGTVAVYRREDLATVRLAADADARAGVTLGSPGPGELGLVEDLLVDRAFPHLPSGDVPGEATVLATLDDLGPVDVDQLAWALAAAALARSFGVPAAAVRDGLRAWTLDRAAPGPPGP